MKLMIFNNAFHKGNALRLCALTERRAIMRYNKQVLTAFHKRNNHRLCVLQECCTFIRCIKQTNFLNAFHKGNALRVLYSKYVTREFRPWTFTTTSPVFMTT